MDIIRRTTVDLCHVLKRLNLFNTYSTNAKQIQHEILTTRIYLILLPMVLTIFIVYSAQMKLYYTVQVSNPTLSTYRQLLDLYPDTLSCPCSQLSLSYSTFVTLTHHLHPICLSDFIKESWFSYLYYDNSSSYKPIDIRSVGNAQFQLLRTLCEFSERVIEDAFKTTFVASVFTNNDGLLLKLDVLRVQVDAFANSFIGNIISEQRRQRALFTIAFDRNFLVSALETSAIPIIDSKLKLQMKIPHYMSAFIGTIVQTQTVCQCDSVYTCVSPLGIVDNSINEPVPSQSVTLVTQSSSLLATVNGFQSGCLPLNSLLLSTLECYNNQSCLSNFMDYLPAINVSFHILDRSMLNQSTPTTLINTIADQLMVEQWSTEMNYSRYFDECHPIFCSYIYMERFSITYVFTTVVGLLGGIISILRLLCPWLTRILYKTRSFVLSKKKSRPMGPLQTGKIIGMNLSEQRQPLKARIHELFAKTYKKVYTLNLFTRRNSSASDIREQIISTRFYIACLIMFTLVLTSVTTLEQRMTTNSVLNPTITEFENLYRSGKLTHSCSCSRIAIPRSEFISLTQTFHQVCFSQLLTPDWLDRLSYTTNTRSAYYYLDIRSYGLDMFRTILSFCSLVNETILDASKDFLTTDWISTQVLSRQQFYEQVETVIADFELEVKNTFKRSFIIVREIHQADQVLSSRVSNFFFNGIFDNSSHLVDVKTYTGTLSSVTDVLPTCSCVFNTCNQQLGFYQTKRGGQTYALIVNVPGMFSACYPVDGVRMSTFECWFNETCIALVLSNLAPFPVKEYFDPLQTSKLIRFSPNTRIGDIIDELMVESWTNITSYESYYNSCKPLICSYTTYHRFNWFYTITILASVFGGLSLSLRIICQFTIKFYFKWRQRRTTTMPGQLATVSVNLMSRVITQVRYTLSTIKLFNSDSPHVHIQRREQLSTHLFIILFVIIYVLLFIYMLFVTHTRSVTENNPSSDLIAHLNDKYSMTLSCPCMQTSIPYSNFLSLEVSSYHSICSSSLLSQEYLQALSGDEMIILPESKSFKRQFLAAQLSLLNRLCLMIKQTVNTSITHFLQQRFIAAQVLTADQFYEQINITFNRFYLDISLALRHSIDFLQSVTHGNAIMSSYVSNWRFQPSSATNSSTILTRPVSYANCSCASSTQCSLPLSIDNVTFPGLAIGCLPSTVLLQTTLQCFYNQTCLDTLHNTIFKNVTIPSLPNSLNKSKYYSFNASVGALLNELFIEGWSHQNDFEAFFRTCQVLACTYTYSVQPDVLYIVTTMIGIIGGLTAVFRLVCPVLILIFMYLINRIRREPSTWTEIIMPSIVPINVGRRVSSPQDTAISDERTTLNSIDPWWRNDRRLKTIIAVVIFIVIILTVSPIMLKRLLSSSSTTNSSYSSTIVSTPESKISTMKVPLISLCSANATWNNKAVTVAGFTNETYSEPLATLYSPNDLFIDSIGNMHILDSLNYRILYWPNNSTEGRIVAGTGEPGSDADQLFYAVSFAVGQGQMYVSDVANQRVQAFPFTTSPGSPNATTILGQNFVGNERSMPIIVLGMAFAYKSGLLYLNDYLNRRLLILNISDDNVQIVVDSELSIMNSSISLHPTGIVIDEIANTFYVSDALSNIVVKFQINSTIGNVVAGRLISSSIYNQLNQPIGMAIDSSGYLYIADSGYNRVVQLINGNGDLRTIAGVGFFGATVTRLFGPTMIKFDQYYNLYVADSNNNRIQRFDLLDNGC
ncbi:unnamed protein product [Adineta ricciae]|uniref:Uncharacterized protein n=1 Tax=Adineta ricciae TaxID=249248 RepID=A0A813WDX6_ADIRI|nr:unnamed protein product [Adineta ricciae]CAF1080673.1 unnamed protein product [Adineta ricciae]